MNVFGFFMAKWWVVFMSVHPFWLLYLTSDVYFLLIYHVIRYRRKVVRENLLHSFPEKDASSIKAIERQFYHNLCDLFVEAPKMMRMGACGYRKRVKFNNPELAVQLAKQRRNVFYAIPHSGNWEWFGKLIPELSSNKCLAVYKRVKNHVFERLMLEMRTYNCDLEMVESNSVLKRLAQLRNQPTSVLMMADQTSHGLASDYWTEFLNQDTCWFTGLERIAKMLDYAVVFVDMKRTSRGRYEVTFELLSDRPNEEAKGELMEKYVRRIERFIHEQPDNWLWSHKRWKHKRKQEVAE